MQVEKTKELSGSVKAKVTNIEAESRAVVNGTKSVVQASRQQQEVFQKAKAAVGDTLASAEKALAAFRYIFYDVVQDQVT